MYGFFNRRLSNQHGFTMLELMVVVIIVAVLAAVAVPLYTGFIKKARVSEAEARLGQILTAAKSFGQENNTWPTAASAGFFGDLTASPNFTYAITTGGGPVTGTFASTATGTGAMAGVTCVVNVASITAQGTVTVTGL